MEEEEEETRTATPTATATTAAVTATATLTDGTTETAATGVNVAAHLHPEADGIHLTGGAGATPGALQEVAAPAGTTMPPLRRRWLLPPPTPGGKSLRRPPRHRCNWSKGNIKKINDGQEVKVPSDEVIRFRGASSSQIFLPHLSLQNPVKTGPYSVANDPKLSSFHRRRKCFPSTRRSPICFASTKRGWATPESSEAARERCHGISHFTNKAAGVYRRSHDGKSSVVALDAHLAPVFTYHTSSNTFGFNARNVHMSSKIGTRPRNNLLYRDR